MGALKPAERRAFERSKRASAAQLLFKAARLLNEQALARVRARTGMDIRPSHASLFPHIEFAGSRTTDIAKKMGISKQAVGQLVGDLEAMGVVERVADPVDGRAKLVQFAHRDGRLSVMEGMAVLMEFERELTNDVGAAAMEQLKETLASIVDILEG